MLSPDTRAAYGLPPEKPAKIPRPTDLGRQLKSVPLGQTPGKHGLVQNPLPFGDGSWTQGDAVAMPWSNGMHAFWDEKVTPNRAIPLGKSKYDGTERVKDGNKDPEAWARFSAPGSDRAKMLEARETQRESNWDHQDRMDKAHTDQGSEFRDADRANRTDYGYSDAAIPWLDRPLFETDWNPPTVTRTEKRKSLESSSESADMINNSTYVTTKRLESPRAMRWAANALPPLGFGADVVDVVANSDHHNMAGDIGRKWDERGRFWTSNVADTAKDFWNRVANTRMWIADDPRTHEDDPKLQEEGAISGEKYDAPAVGDKGQVETTWQVGKNALTDSQIAAAQAAPKAKKTYYPLDTNQDIEFDGKEKLPVGFIVTEWEKDGRTITYEQAQDGGVPPGAKPTKRVDKWLEPNEVEEFKGLEPWQGGLSGETEVGYMTDSFMTADGVVFSKDDKENKTAIVNKYPDGSVQSYGDGRMPEQKANTTEKDWKIFPGPARPRTSLQDTAEQMPFADPNWNDGKPIWSKDGKLPWAEYPYSIIDGNLGSAPYYIPKYRYVQGAAESYPYLMGYDSSTYRGQMRDGRGGLFNTPLGEGHYEKKDIDNFAATMGVGEAVSNAAVENMSNMMGDDMFTKAAKKWSPDHAGKWIEDIPHWAKAPLRVLAKTFGEGNEEVPTQAFTMGREDGMDNYGRTRVWDPKAQDWAYDQSTPRGKELLKQAFLAWSGGAQIGGAGGAFSELRDKDNRPTIVKNIGQMLPWNKRLPEGEVKNVRGPRPSEIMIAPRYDEHGNETRRSRYRED